MHSVRAESMKALAMEQTAKDVAEMKGRLERIEDQLGVLLKREKERLPADLTEKLNASQKGR